MIWQAKAQQQEESLEAAAARVLELEEHVANLQLVVSAASASTEVTLRIKHQGIDFILPRLEL